MLNIIKSSAYSAAHFMLELDGLAGLGLFRSVEGGNLKADVMTHQDVGEGPGHQRLRIAGKPKYDDLKLQVGMAMSEGFYKWIDDFSTGKAVRQSGSIIAADFSYTERARRHFEQAMIKEITFPKLDGSDKNAAYMSVGIAFETMQFKPPASNPISQLGGMAKQKQWNACNFRFTIDGLDAACRNVTKVDSFTIKQQVVEYHHSGQREAVKCPTRIEYPQLSFYVPESDVYAFTDLAEPRLRLGAPNNAARLTGSIQCLDNEFQPVFEVEFAGSEIISISPDKADASSEEAKQVKIELTTESMRFKYLK